MLKLTLNNQSLLIHLSEKSMHEVSMFISCIWNFAIFYHSTIIHLRNTHYFTLLIIGKKDN